MEESKTTGAPRDPAELKAELAANGASNGANGTNGDAKAAGDAPKTSPEKVKAEEEPVAGPSTSPTKKDVQVVNQAMQYLAAGKRDLLIQDPSSAVASLAQSCELLGEHYGETAPECGEAYYYYGRALLDLARVEAGVIDNVLDGVPEDDSEEPDSMVEDPDECSEEEKEKVANEVGQALEENFEELEKRRKKKEKEAPLMKGEEIEIADKVKADSKGEEETGDSSKGEKGSEKKEGDNSSKAKDKKEEGDVKMESGEVENKESKTKDKEKSSDSKTKLQKEEDIPDEAEGSTKAGNRIKDVSSEEKKVGNKQSKSKEKEEEGKVENSTNIGENKDSKEKEKDNAKVKDMKEGVISEEVKDSTKEVLSPEKKVGDDQSKRNEKKEDGDVEMEDKEVEKSTKESLKQEKSRNSKPEEKKEKDATRIEDVKEADISEETEESTKAEKGTKEVSSPEKEVRDDQSKRKEKKEEDDVEMEGEEVETKMKHEKSKESKTEEKKEKDDTKVEDVKEGNISEEAGGSTKAEKGTKEVLNTKKEEGNDELRLKDKEEGGDAGIKTKESFSPKSQELKEKLQEFVLGQTKGKDNEAGDSKKAENGTKEGLESGEKKVGSGLSDQKEKNDSNDVDMNSAEESEENSADDEDGDDEPEGEGEGEEKAEEEDGDDKKEEAEEEDGKDESIASDTEANTVAKDTGDAAAVDKEDEEDPSNLQLSWEMLELAKTIFMRQAEGMKEGTEKERESKFNVESRICDIFQTLGELSIENENYEQAIEDLQTCLERRQKLLPEDSRLIAETFYQLGVAQGFSIRFDDAVESLMSAIGVLQTRVENLKVEKESKDPAKKNDAFYTREGEIKELEGLIPEIREKIADTKDMKEETRKKLGDRRLMEEEICSSAFKAANGSSSSSAAAATNGGGSSKTISTLQVKKRKKSGGDEKESEAKKPHLETSSSNGHGPSTSK